MSCVNAINREKCVNNLRNVLLMLAPLKSFFLDRYDDDGQAHPDRLPRVKSQIDDRNTAATMCAGRFLQGLRDAPARVICASAAFAVLASPLSAPWDQAAADCGRD